MWTRALDIDAGKNDSCNGFIIAYIVSTGFCELFFLSADMIKAVESLLIRGRSRTKSRDPIRTSSGDSLGSSGEGGEPSQLE